MVVTWSTNATANYIPTQLNQCSGSLGPGIMRPDLTRDPVSVRALSGVDDGQNRYGSTQQNVGNVPGDGMGGSSSPPAPTRPPSTSEDDGTRQTRARKSRDERKTAIQIASLNINGFGNLVKDHEDNKWGRIYRMMAEHRIGVLLLQETHLTEERVAGIHKMFARKIRVLFSANPEAPTQREGVAIVLNSRYVNTKTASATVIVPGRAIQVTLTCQGGDAKTFLCSYAPTSNGAAERKRYFEEVRKFYEDNGEITRPHLMGGDFNNVEDPVDRLPIKDNPDQSVAALDELKLSLGFMLSDGWRLTYPTRREYTFHRGTGPQAVFSRLDRIYVTPETFDLTREWTISEAGIRTDHSLTLVQLTPKNAPIVGPGRPTFPMQLIKDKRLARAVKERGIEAMRELATIEAEGGRSEQRNPQRILHGLKRDIMKLAREREKQVVPKLLAEIRDHESALRKTKASKELDERSKIAEAEALTKQIRQLKLRRYKQQQQNSRATHRLYGDRPTKYWSKLHRECAPRDIITAFEKEGQRGVAGEKLYENDSKKMADMARTHHMSVQRDDESIKPAEVRELDIVEALESLDAKVTPHQALELGSKISYEESILSLRFAKNGTSPGLDGIPFELWKILHARHVEDSRFPDRTDFDVVRLLTAAFEDMRSYGVEADTTFANGWIAPIYKEKGERSRVVNYRPITLLNTDYKLLSKTLAVRLAEVAPVIIHKAQAGFVPGRKIHNHTQLARMMMHWTEINEQDGAIVALDQEKAYDKIAHDYLWRVLEKFGIPDSFIGLIKSLYRNARTSVMVNGILSTAYRVYRGVRQGDPLSCLLFDLAIEPLSAMIRKSDIEGFSIPSSSETLKAVLFADDTTVYLSSRDDFSTLQKVLDTWCSAAKAKFNISKTEIIPLGRPAFREEMASTYRCTGAWENYPKGIHVAQEGEAVRILGAFFGNGIDQTDVWSLVLTKIVAMRQPLMQVMARWRDGHATVHGKKQVVQMIVGGMTQYLTTVQRMPETICKRLNKIIRDYLWEDRRNTPVGMKHVCLPVDQGGLGMVHLESRNEAIDIMWLKAYLCMGQERPLWAFLADDILANHVPKNCRPSTRALRVNPFFQKWSPKLRGLPEELKGMLKVAKKYGVRLEGLAFSRDILKQMPLWDHEKADSRKLGRLTMPSKLRSCLIDRHEVRTVGDFVALAMALESPMHRRKASCKCAKCNHLRVTVGCENPFACASRARDMLDTLPHKWNPLKSQPEDCEVRQRGTPEERENDEIMVTFDRNVTTYGDLGQAVRIFTEAEPVSNEQISMELEEDGRRVIVATDGSSIRNGERDAQAGAGIYVEECQRLNQSCRLPEEIEQTNQTGEMAALLLAASIVDTRTRVHLETDSQTSLGALTKWRSKHEDQGYILQENSELTRATIARLRMRKSHTLLKWVKGHNGHSRNEAADRLAAIAARKPTSDRIDLTIPAPYRVTGAKLQAMTQKLAYRAIRSRKDKAVQPRPRTIANLDRITSGVKAKYGVDLHERSIWKSLRRRHMSRAASQFIWMAIHDGYMIGTHWLRPNMPEDLQARAVCRICGECETMTHITLECEAVGQKIVWELLREMWQLTQAQWHEPCWGTTFGAACAVFKTPDGGRKTAAENLWCILCTESLHLIWRLRCERVIQKEGSEFTEAEVTNRFYAALESRLNLDRRTAAMAASKRALKPQDVETIWRPVLEGKDSLPPNWVVNNGVLVGIKRGR